MPPSIGAGSRGADPPHPLPSPALPAAWATALPQHLSARWAGGLVESKLSGPGQRHSHIPWGSWQVRRQRSEYPPLPPFLRFPIQGFLSFLEPCRGLHLSTVFGTDVDGRWWYGRLTRWSDEAPLCPWPGPPPRSLQVPEGLPWSPCVPEAAARGFLGHWLSLCVKAWAAGLWGSARGLGREHSSRTPRV